MTGQENLGRSDSGTEHKVGQKTEQISSKARDTVSQAGEKARGQIESTASMQKDRATQGLTSVAQAFRKAGDELRHSDQNAVAGVTDRFADQVDRFSGYLKNKTVGELVNDVEHFARREPALFLGAAFAIGLIGSRFIKSSNPSSAYRTTRPEYGGYREGHMYPPTDYGYGSMYGRRDVIRDNPYEDYGRRTTERSFGGATSHDPDRFTDPDRPTRGTTSRDEPEFYGSSGQKETDVTPATSTRRDWKTEASDFGIGDEVGDKDYTRRGGKP